MGRRLVILQNADFEKSVAYYKSLKLEDAVFSGDNKLLLKYSHAVAFSMVMWAQKLSDAPEWALPYLLQLKTDAIHLIPSTILGNKRTLHLYERAGIEDFLRYVYFFDHRIEHLLLQNQARRFKNFDFLIEWLKNYPLLGSYEENISESCGELSSRYSELSRTVHGTTLADAELTDSLKNLQKPIEHPSVETNMMKSIFRNIFFLLSLFHLEKYNRLSLDEKMIICQHLSAKEKQILSKLDQG